MTYTKKEQIYANLKMWEDAPMNATGSATSTHEPIVKKKKKGKDVYEPSQIFDLIKRNSNV
jgi:hypothetical protein